MLNPNTNKNNDTTIFFSNTHELFVNKSANNTDYYIEKALGYLRFRKTDDPTVVGRINITAVDYTRCEFQITPSPCLSYETFSMIEVTSYNFTNNELLSIPITLVFDFATDIKSVGENQSSVRVSPNPFA